jgi:hypothetical protein
MTTEIKRDLQYEISIDHVLAVLNEAVELDKDAMTALVNARVPCNERLADHPTIQVGSFDGITKVGLLGVLNGLFGIASDGWGAIGADFDSNGKVVGFRQVRDRQVK